MPPVIAPDRKPDAVMLPPGSGDASEIGIKLRDVLGKRYVPIQNHTSFSLCWGLDKPPHETPADLARKFSHDLSGDFSLKYLPGHSRAGEARYDWFAADEAFKPGDHVPSHDWHLGRVLLGYKRPETGDVDADHESVVAANEAAMDRVAAKLKDPILASVVADTAIRNPIEVAAKPA